MRYLSRSRRWRQAFFAACLPYILVSILVESLHVAPKPGGSDVIGGSAISLAAGLPRSATEPYSCPACAWQRVGTEQVQHIGISANGDTVRVPPVPRVAEWPDSPVPRPAAFRGPPALA